MNPATMDLLAVIPDNYGTACSDSVEYSWTAEAIAIAAREPILLLLSGKQRLKIKAGGRPPSPSKHVDRDERKSLTLWGLSVFIFSLFLFAGPSAPRSPRVGQRQHSKQGEKERTDSYYYQLLLPAPTFSAGKVIIGSHRVTWLIVREGRRDEVPGPMGGGEFTS